MLALHSIVAGNNRPRIAVFSRGQLRQRLQGRTSQLACYIALRLSFTRAEPAFSGITALQAAQTQ